MRLAIGSGIFPPDIGGPATYVDGLARELAGRGLPVEVVTYGDGGEGAGGGEPFPVHRVSRARPLPARYAAYRRALRSAAARADVVYLQDPLSAGLPGLLGARAAGRPVLLKVVSDLAWEMARGMGLAPDAHEGSPDAVRAPWLAPLRWAQSWVARRADGVLVPARHLATMVEGWGVRADRIHVVPNGAAPVPLPADREAARRALGSPAAVVLASVGRLLPYKGFDLVIDTVARLRQAGTDAGAVLVGSGPALAELQDRAQRLGLSPVIRFTGAVDRATAIAHVAASDVFLLLSTHEGRAHVLLEAMQAGCPVVASDVPGNRELVEDGVTGCLVPRDAERAAQAVRALMADPEGRQRLAATARGRTAGSGWTVMVDQTLALLDHVQARPVARAAASISA